jgi:hypothetical protein
MTCRQYITETKIYVENSQTPSQCNSILFINTGSVAVVVDGLTLQPNQSWEISGNRDEMNIKVYPFNFVAGANPQLTIIYKRYVTG